MKTWWQFPNTSRVAEAARLGLALSGVATLAWAFTDSPAPAASRASTLASPPPNAADTSPEDLARWMRETSAERGAGETLRAALGEVGPWAKDQATNDARARVPTPRIPPGASPGARSSSSSSSSPSSSSSS